MSKLTHAIAVVCAALLTLALSACAAQEEPAPNSTPPPVQRREGVYQPKAGELVLRETTTNSLFNVRGEAIAGSLAEAKVTLEQLPASTMFWFAWSNFFPGARVWNPTGADKSVRAATLPSDKTGGAGCGGGKDCIPSLPNTGAPRGELTWATVGDSGASYLRDDDLVVGMFIDGTARAYPHNILWWHEIANDRIGEQSFSVTFCPLTGSALVFDASKTTFGVSGQLFNSNLVMYDHATGSLWPQLWTGPVAGPESPQGDAPTGSWLTLLPHQEMTWARWQELHPDTLVLSSATGYSRDYTQYPYGGHRENDSTFRLTDPPPDPMYQAKSMTLGIFDRASGAARAWVHADLAQRSPRTVLEDRFAGRPIVVVYDGPARLALVFEAEVGGQTLRLSAESYAPDQP